MGYDAPVDTLDVSNSNTPGVIDPTNPVTGAVLPRRGASSTSSGKFHFTETNAYSGNNGRAAIVADGDASDPRSSRPATRATATQLRSRQTGVDPRRRRADHRARRSGPRRPRTRAADTGRQLQRHRSSATQQDKIGKDDNFRGMTISNNVLYYTKGSGGNGVNTVYFVDTTGTACPNGVGLPAAGRAAADRARSPTTCAALQARRAAAEQHVHPEGLPDRCSPSERPSVSSRSGSGSPTRTRSTWPTRAAVTTRTRRRPARTPTPLPRQQPDGRPAEVGLRRRHRQWKLAYTLRRASTSVSPTRSPATRRVTTRRPGCRGRRPPTACATSPAGSTATGRPRSGRSPRR